MTASSSLWPGPRCPSVSLGASATRTCELLIESPPSCAPSHRCFLPGDGRVPAADALCRALLGKDTRTASSAASSKDSVVDRPERLASVSSPRSPLAWAPLSRDFGGVSKADACNLHEPRARPGSPEPRSAFPRLPPVPPRLPSAAASPGDPVSSRSLARSLTRIGSAELSSIRGLCRRHPCGLCRLQRPPVAIARPEVGYPDLGDPDTFCRRRVARRAGGAHLTGCLRILLRAHPASPLARDPRPGASLSQDLPAGWLPVTPREGLHVPRTQGAFHRGRPFLVDRGAPARRSAQDQFDPGKVGDCPQVVPSLWISRRRLFNPC